MTTPPGSVSSLIAAELRAELARQNRSRRWLADQIGHSHVTVGRWLNGGHFPFDALLEMCDALGLSVPDLFAAVDRRRKQKPQGPRRRLSDVRLSVA